MENGNFCLIWNYNLLVVRKFFEVTLVKKIYQNTSKYRIPLFQKYYKSGRTLNRRLTFTLLNSYKRKIYGKTLLYESETIPHTVNHGLQKELDTWVIWWKIQHIFYSLMIWQNILIWKQTSLLSNGWYQRLKPYGKATKKTYTILPPTTKLSLILFKGKTTKQTSIWNSCW